MKRPPSRYCPHGAFPSVSSTAAPASLLCSTAPLANPPAARHPAPPPSHISHPAARNPPDRPGHIFHHETLRPRRIALADHAEAISPRRCLALRAKPRHPHIKRIRVRSGVMKTDVCVGKMLITIADRHRLPLLAKDVNTHAKVDDEHKSRSLRREHLVGEVEKTSVIAKERLHPAARKKVRLKSFRAHSAAVATLPMVEWCCSLRSRPIDHRQRRNLRRVAKCPIFVQQEPVGVPHIDRHVLHTARVAKDMSADK